MTEQQHIGPYPTEPPVPRTVRLPGAPNPIDWPADDPNAQFEIMWQFLNEKPDNCEIVVQAINCYAIGFTFRSSWQKCPDKEEDCRGLCRIISKLR